MAHPDDETEDAIVDLCETGEHRASGGKIIENTTPFSMLHEHRDGSECLVGPGARVLLREGERLVWLPPMHTVPWMPSIQGSQINGTTYRLLNAAVEVIATSQGVVRNTEHLRALLVSKGFHIGPATARGLVGMLLELAFITPFDARCTTTQVFSA